MLATLFGTTLSLFGTTLSTGVAPSSAATGYTYASQFVNMLVGLGAILIILFCTIWVMKKISRISWLKPIHTSRLVIKERKVLSNKSTLYVIEMDGETILIGESVGGISVVHRTTLSAESHEANEPVPSPPLPLPHSSFRRFFLRRP